ncbi:hypothetical protein VTN02DRAFT_4658 [Thermoascus thermophilus]
MAKPYRHHCPYCDTASWDKMSTVEDMESAIAKSITKSLWKAVSIINDYPGALKKVGGSQDEMRLSSRLLDALLVALRFVDKYPGKPAGNGEEEQLLNGDLIEALHTALTIVNKHQNRQQKEGSSQEEKRLTDLVLHIDDIVDRAFKKGIIGLDRSKRWHKDLKNVMNAALSVSYMSEVTGQYTYSGRACR